MGKETWTEREEPAASPVDAENPVREAPPARGARSGIFRREGTSALVGELYREHAAFVRALVRRSDVHPDAAETIVERAFFKLGEKIEEGEVPANARAVLRKLAMNLLLNHLRDPRRELEEFEDLDVDQVPKSAPDAEQAIILGEDQQLVHELLEELPESKAELLRQVELDERPIVELAAERGLLPTTLRSKAKRAREAFQRLLEERLRELGLLALLALALGAAALATWSAVRVWQSADKLRPEAAFAPLQAEDPQPAATPSATASAVEKKEAPRPAKPAQPTRSGRPGW